MLSITPVTVAGYQCVVVGRDMDSGLKAIIAIHDTTLGPALGGARMWPFQSEDEALQDALRLARGMTCKAAVAGLTLGGGKSVIIGNPANKSEALLRSFGRLVHSLGGMYITAEDVGTSQRDMDLIRQETPHVVGVSPELGGSGDPAPYTALGVFQGIRAAALFLWGHPDLRDRAVAVQGVGQVGFELCKLLHNAGARLTVCDINPENLRRAVSEFNARAVTPEEIYRQEAEIFAPCALGGVINDQTVKQLRCCAVAGAANNVLDNDRHGELLHRRGILYVPDYVINAGGLINVSSELDGHSRERVIGRTKGIFHTVKEILAMAQKIDIPPFRATEELVARKLKHMEKKQVVEG
ncbi:MAG: Leu/Phe/Val dehydrogenase [Bacillota bacterium]